MSNLKSLYVQFALAIALALFLSLMMHSDLVHAFASEHPAIRTALAFITFPAVVFAFLIGGHGPSASELTFGLVLEFIIIFLVWRLVALGISKLESSLT